MHVGKVRSQPSSGAVHSAHLNNYSLLERSAKENLDTFQNWQTTNLCQVLALTSIKQGPQIETNLSKQESFQR
jgi:hypothetical protein